jgi:Flp pilus assembly protein protease CpaA
MSPFFPSPAFGWAFLSALGAILVAACYFDLRHLTIPNKLTVPALLAGFSANTIRGAWLGLENGSVWAGAVDGIWFALLGFLLGFVLFFVFWQMGICGGGDLKLFAAVASWLGWLFFLGLVGLVYIVGNDLDNTQRNPLHLPKSPAGWGESNGPRLGAAWQKAPWSPPLRFAPYVICCGRDVVVLPRRVEVS